MPDVFSETTHTSYGGKISGSIKGVLIGLILFVVSFGVLYWNEGRVNLAPYAKKSIPVDATQTATVNAQTLVALSGQLTSSTNLGDTYVKQGKYLALQRNVEIFAWTQETQSDKKKNLGGSEDTTTTYTYKKEWVKSPAESSKFKISDGHLNVPKTINDELLRNENAAIGKYTFNPGMITLPDFQKLPLTGSLVNANGKLVNDYLYFGKGTITEPQIGDQRISYNYLPLNQNVTAFGTISGSTLSSYRAGKVTLFHLFYGTKDDGITALQQDYTMKLWGFRLLGFLFMLFGLNMIMSPIGALMDVIPLLGSVTKGTLFFLSLIVSLVLSIVTIVVSAIFHSLLALVIIIALTLIFLLVWYKKRKK